MYVSSLFLLVFFMGSAFADWELISSTDQAEIYIDRDSIQAGETITSVWELQNIGYYEGDNRISYRYLSQYDCFNRLWMYSVFTKHNGPMATGKIIYRSNKPVGWREVPPNTPASSVLKEVCPLTKANIK